MLVGILMELLTWATINLRPSSGIVDTTMENSLFFVGLYLAIPCGILNLILAGSAQSKGVIDQKVARIAILLGWSGILLGLLAWALFLMFSSFVF